MYILPKQLLAVGVLAALSTDPVKGPARISHFTAVNFCAQAAEIVHVTFATLS